MLNFSQVHHTIEHFTCAWVKDDNFQNTESQNFCDLYSDYQEKEPFLDFQNTEFSINTENFHPCMCFMCLRTQIRSVLVYIYI